VTDNTYSLASQLDADQYDAEFRLKQDIKELVDVIRGMFSLVTDEILVRNIARDAELGVYYPNAARLVLALKKAEKVIAKYEAK
jgi:hypothetical protein